MLGDPYTAMRPVGEAQVTTTNPPAYTEGTIAISATSATSSRATNAEYVEASFAYVPISNRPRVGSKKRST